ncbi:hypothetical protein C8D72_3226 [Kushneria indalinina DSM 14324]|uniref:Uncharacterized protein n=1 Tax=Kushneria indalinina DSM 14324 TaxID=1122140 RepID=A0A3D9DSV3_9GAMM|nr:hypothetical protein C8D72_3226 [Kushneria indalinina DSM 14324]
MGAAVLMLSGTTQRRMQAMIHYLTVMTRQAAC